MDIGRIEGLAVFGFASLVAWRLLDFFLNQYTRKLDCIKDTLIQILDRLDKVGDAVAESKRRR